MVSLQFGKTFTPRTEGNRVQGEAVLQAGIGMDTHAGEEEFTGSWN